MTRAIENRITDGVIWKGILYFFFPILFGTFFQQLYNTVDAIIVGQFLGKEALAAVGGGTSTIINLLIGFFTGLASGASVVISQRYGAEREDRVNDAIHTAIALALVGSVIITIVGYFSTDWTLELIGTLDDIMPLASTYMKIYYIGCITLVVYNMAAGVLRALGDSKHPLYFLCAGCITNIVLDIVFISVFKMGVAGAAYATVISQAVSMLLTVGYLMRQKGYLKLRIKRIRFAHNEINDMLRIGFPAGIQSIMYTISNLIIQSNINSFGTDTAAAWAAYGKLDSVYWMLINAFGIAITTFAGQNYGAGKIDRIKKGVTATSLMAGGVTIVISIVFCLWGRWGYMLFTNDANVIDIGMFMMRTIAPAYITYIMVEILSGAIRGAGKAFVPTMICIIGVCLLRILWLSTVAKYNHTVFTVIFCYPVTWVITSLAFIVYYAKGKWALNEHHSFHMPKLKRR